MKNWIRDIKKYWWLYLLLPITLVVNPWGYDAFENEKVSIFLLACGIALPTVCRNRRIIMQELQDATYKTPSLYYSLYVGWATVATLFSVAPIRSLMGSILRREGLVTIVLCFVWYWYIRLQERNNERVLQILGKVSLVIITATSILALVQLYVGNFIYTDIPLIDTDKPLYLLRPSSTFGHPLYFAIAIMTLLPFAYAYLKTLTKKIKYSLMVMVGSVMIPALYVTRSRVVVAMAVAWIVAYLYQNWNKKIALVSCGVVVISMGALFANSNIRSVYLRLPSVVVRLYEWNYGISYIVKSPFFGYGFETYDVFSVARERKEGEPNDGIADRLHIWLLDIPWETGIPSLLFYGGMWILVLSPRKKREGIGAAAYYASAQYMCAMLTMFNFSFGFYIVPLLLALLDAPLVQNREKNSWGMYVGSFGLGIIVIAPSISLVLLYRCLVPDQFNGEQSRIDCRIARKITPWYGELYMFERDTLKNDDTTQEARIQLMETARKVGAPSYKNLSPE